MVHLFGWGQRPVNRYKAYDCFCRAHSAGCSAAALNGAVCKWLGYGCKQNKEEALSILNAFAESDSSPPLTRIIASVRWRIARLFCVWLSTFGPVVHTQINASTIQPVSNQYYGTLMKRTDSVPAPVLCERHRFSLPDEMPDRQQMERLSSSFADGFTFAGYL